MTLMQLKMDLELKPKILLITPPLTQLNTPYPGTAYLNYFLSPNYFNTILCSMATDLLINIFPLKLILCRIGIESFYVSEVLNKINR